MSGRGPDSPLTLRMKPLPHRYRAPVVLSNQESALPGQADDAEPSAPSLRVLRVAPEIPKSTVTLSDQVSLGCGKQPSQTPAVDPSAHLDALAPSREPPNFCEVNVESDDAASRPLQSRSSVNTGIGMPFIYCKISAQNLPQYDVFTSSDPVCFVREVYGNRIIRKCSLSIDNVISCLFTALKNNLLRSYIKYCFFTTHHSDTPQIAPRSYPMMQTPTSSRIYA